MKYLVGIEKVEMVTVESIAADVVVKAGDELVLYAEAAPSLKTEEGELLVTTRLSCEVSKYPKPQEELEKIELVCPEEVQKIVISTTSGKVSLYSLKVRELLVNKVFGKVTLHECDVKDLNLRVVSGSVEVKNVYSENAVLELVSGSVICEDIHGRKWEMITTAGDVKLIFSEMPDLRVRFETASGRFLSNVPYFSKTNDMVFGLGGDFVLVKTSSGDLKLEVARSKDKLVEKILRMFLKGKISKETAERLLREMRGD